MNFPNQQKLRILEAKMELNITAYLRRRHDFPTPLFPMRRSLKR